MKAIKFLSIIIAGILVLSISSCSKDAGFGGNSTIKGNVTNAAGTAVTGAVVSLSFGATAPTTTVNYTTLTDASGNYSFNDLEPGNYFVTASYTDYVDQGQSIALQSGGATVKLGGNKSTATVNLTVQ